MEVFKMQVYTKVIREDNGETVGYFNNVLDANEFIKKQKYACLIENYVSYDEALKIIDDFIYELLNEID
jgi:hypothetical protein